MCASSVPVGHGEDSHRLCSHRCSYERVALISKLGFKNSILFLDRNTDVLTVLKSTVLADL